MRSSFFEFHVAKSGMFTAQAGLQTVAHNTANAATRGFSRQVAVSSANHPLQLFNGRGMVGTGSSVHSIIQIRDVHLDRKFWGSQPILGQYSVKRTHLSIVETIFSELEGTGLTSLFNDFFDALQDLTTTAGDATHRTNILMSADSITTFMQDTYEALLAHQRNVNEEIAAVVTTINSLGNQIRTLNERIRVMEITGDNANDLRDQRALLVDELSRYVNVEAYERDLGNGDRRFFVRINGQEFVSNRDIRTLTLRPRVMTADDGSIIHFARNGEDNAGMFDLFWGNSDVRFNIYSPTLRGELRGLIDIRDGNNGQHVRLSTGSMVWDNAPTPPTLTIPLSYLANRQDLSEGGGVIRIIDANGHPREFIYRDFTINQGLGTVEFEIAYRDPAERASIDTFITTVGATGTMTVGQTTEFKGIPYYLNRLNVLARTFFTAINFGTRLDGTPLDEVIGHIDGYNVAGENIQRLFFTDRGVPPLETADILADWHFLTHQIRANNMRVSRELLDEPHLMNSSSGGTAHGVDNNNTLLSWLRVSNDVTLFREGRILDFVIGMTGELAIDIKQADAFERNYNSLTRQIDIMRMSVSGVDINEEMVDMIRLNQQWQAAARLINVIDGIYDMLVNRLGLT